MHQVAFVSGGEMGNPNPLVWVINDPVGNGDPSTTSVPPGDYDRSNEGPVSMGGVANPGACLNTVNNGSSTGGVLGGIAGVALGSITAYFTGGGALLFGGAFGILGGGTGTLAGGAVGASTPPCAPNRTW